MVAQPAYSMTGSGFASGPTELGVAHVEIRSVNGRTLVVKQRVCSEFQGLEAAVEARIRRCLARGNVLVTMDLTREAPADSMLDQEAAERAVAELRELGGRLGLNDDIGLRDVVMVPGLFANTGSQRPRTSWEPAPQLAALLDQSLDSLVEDRARGGANTASAMNEEVERLGELLVAAGNRAGQVVDQHRQKLLRRVNEFLKDQTRPLEDADVIREVALFADRADVAEELQRLGAHLERVREHLGQGGTVGRTLEFLLQEALREANTLGSKSQDAALAHIAVDMKSGIDKLKEQAANLE